MVRLLATTALATPAGPFVDGFAIDGREDAPTDARLLFGANYTPAAIVASGPGESGVLRVEMLVAYSMGNDPLVAVLPPEGGWVTGAPYVVRVIDESYGLSGSSPFDLAFTAGEAPAADPVAPEVIEVEVGAWTADEYYGWGCCAPTRSVAVTIRNHAEDPWSLVELRGDFEGPSQLTTSPVLRHLGAGIGLGHHTITFTQWKAGGDLHPTCFAVAAIAADGDEADEIPLCVDERGRVSAEGCGCSHRVAPVSPFPLVILAVALRRRAP